MCVCKSRVCGKTGKKTIVPEGPTMRTYSCFCIVQKKKMSHFAEIAQTVSPESFPEIRGSCSFQETRLKIWKKNERTHTRARRADSKTLRRTISPRRLIGPRGIFRRSHLRIAAVFQALSDAISEHPRMPPRRDLVSFLFICHSLRARNRRQHVIEPKQIRRISSWNEYNTWRYCYEIYNLKSLRLASIYKWWYSREQAICSTTVFS